jgi:hypothetical protein
MVQADTVVFEIEDNFKQDTNRNRTYIYSPMVSALEYPIKHYKNQKQRYYR